MVKYIAKMHLGRQIFSGQITINIIKNKIYLLFNKLSKVKKLS